MYKNRFIFHGWLIVITGIVVYVLGYGARYSFSVVFDALLKEFQWARDTTATILSVHMIVYGCIAPLAGYLVDSVGPRKTMSFGTILLASGLVLSVWANQPWHFYLSFGVLSGTGLCLIGSVPFTTVIRNWFEKRRSLALSLLFFGVGAAFATYPVVAFLIGRVGWRKAFGLEAITILCCLLPLIILIVRYRPEDMGLFIDGGSDSVDVSVATGDKRSGHTSGTLILPEWTLKAAVKTGRFWMLCMSTFCVWGIVQTLMVTHHVVFALDIGYSRVYASSVLSLFGALFACGSLAGVLCDRIGHERTMTVATCIGISGIFALTSLKDSTGSWMLYYYALAFGFGQGMAVPAIVASAITIFRGRKVGSVLGCLWFSFAIGGSIGPWLGGWFFELTGQYMVAFVVAMLLYAVGCVAIWCAAPRKAQCSESSGVRL